MNSCDLASQVWSHYSVSRYSHWRNRWPMLWLILDASIANVLYLYRLKGFTEADISHRDLQTTIALQLLRNPACVLRNREPQGFTLGLQPYRIPKPQHDWCKPGKRGECEQCKTPTFKTGRPKKAYRAPLQEISTNRRLRNPRSSYKCKQCDVWLCRNSGCWSRYHGVFDTA